MNTAKHINELNAVLVRYSLSIRGKEVTKVAYFEDKEDALYWASSTEKRARAMGAEMNLISAKIATLDPKFWDIRKDYWNFRAESVRANMAAK